MEKTLQEEIMKERIAGISEDRKWGICCIMCVC